MVTQRNTDRILGLTAPERLGHVRMRPCFVITNTINYLFEYSIDYHFGIMSSVASYSNFVYRRLQSLKVDNIDFDKRLEDMDEPFAVAFVSTLSYAKDNFTDDPNKQFKEPKRLPDQKRRLEVFKRLISTKERYPFMDKSPSKWNQQDWLKAFGAAHSQYLMVGNEFRKEEQKGI
jgi:hypothetical protein